MAALIMLGALLLFGWMAYSAGNKSPKGNSSNKTTPCYMCHGKGICPHCGGFPLSRPQAAPGHDKCEFCKFNAGKCSHCRGTGYI